MVEAGGWQCFAKPVEILLKMLLHRARQRLLAPAIHRRGWQRRLVEFGFDDTFADRFLRVERRKAADEILKLANVARPAIPRQLFHRARLDRLHRQAFAVAEREEMPDEIGDVLAALAQRR